MLFEHSWSCKNEKKNITIEICILSQFRRSYIKKKKKITFCFLMIHLKVSNYLNSDTKTIYTDG